MKKILLGMSLICLLVGQINAVTGLVNLGFDFPWGATVRYEHNVADRGVGGSLSMLDLNVGSTKLSAKSIGASYTLYSKTAFKGFYFGPAIAFRQLKLTQPESRILGTITTSPVNAKIDLIDLHTNFGYSFLIADRVNLRLGGKIGYGLGSLKFTQGTETDLSFNPSGLTWALTSAIGFAF